MPYTIEMVDHADAELSAAFQRLIPQLNPAHTPPGLAELEAILESGTTELLVARAMPGGAIIAALALVVFSTPAGRHAWIEDVIVDAPWRGQGIASALTRAAIDRASQRGAKAIDLTSNPARVEANRLYQNMGFEQRSTNLYRYPLNPKK